MKLLAILLASALAAAAPVESAAPAKAQAEPVNGVYLLGSLHALHGREPEFDYRKLARLVEVLRPDVLVLEVTPKELEKRSETRGRPEYPNAIWPYLESRRLIVVAMEPDEPLYGELVGNASQAFQEFGKNSPEQAAFLKSYKESLDQVLMRYWTNPGETQNDHTADLTAALARLQELLVGGKFEETQKRWDEYMVGKSVAAIREHPRARILVMASYRNRHLFDEALRREAPDRFVDMELWLKNDGAAEQ